MSEVEQILRQWIDQEKITGAYKLRTISPSNAPDILLQMIECIGYHDPQHIDKTQMFEDAEKVPHTFSIKSSSHGVPTLYASDGSESVLVHLTNEIIHMLIDGLKDALLAIHSKQVKGDNEE